MRTLGQMGLVIALLKRMEDYIPEKKAIEQVRYNEVIGVADRIVALFNGRQDPLPVAVQMAAHGAASGRPVEACVNLIERALADSGVAIVPEGLNGKTFALAEHLAHALFRPLVMATPGMGLEAWLESDDTGSSSLFMVSVLAPVGVAVPRRDERLRKAEHPLDDDDFGRCHRLLQVVPEWRDQLDRVAQAGGPVWKLLVEHWAELTALHEARKGRELHDLIRALETQAEAK